MRRKNECERSWWSGRVAVTAFALVLGVLTFCGNAASLPKPGGAVPAVPGKDKEEALTRVYQHTYDEVFQASLETIERLGMFVTDKDKDKGTISGNGEYSYPCGAAGPCRPKLTFDINVETVSAKPEVRVKIQMVPPRRGRGVFPPVFFAELQKVLSTYH
jgi:hypothetical protein